MGEQYLEYYWLREDEIPEEYIGDVFDWMFEVAQELSEEDEFRIIRSN